MAAVAVSLVKSSLCWMFNVYMYNVRYVTDNQFFHHNDLFHLFQLQY